MPVVRDGALIAAAAFFRSITIGLTGVTLAIYLADLGLSAVAIGVLVGAGLAGAAIATLAQSFFADELGRRRILIALTFLMALGYVALASRRVASLAQLLPVTFFGMVNGMGRDRGAAAALDQAILPGTTTDGRRTWTLAWYNVALDAGHAIGALAGAIPSLLASAFSLDATAAHRVTFLLCGAMMGASSIPYLLLSERVESFDRRPEALQHDAAAGGHPTLTQADQHTHSLIVRLTLLFGLDSLGGGFLNTALLAFWFFERFGISEGRIAVLFFAARTLNALSHVAAAWLAKRIGLVNTMVATHLPSSLFVMLVPVAPSAGIASVLFLAREALVEMDVPTRQSYLMAIVRPDERTLASGVTSVTRNAGWAAGPTLAGILMQHVSMAGPLYVGSALKIAYDLILYRSFRKIRPPEEMKNEE